MAGDGGEMSGGDWVTDEVGGVGVDIGVESGERGV